MKKTDLIATRPYKPEDRNFIISIWLSSLKYGNSGKDHRGEMIYSWFGAMPDELYREKFGQIFTKMINDPKITFMVACLRDDEDTILGFVSYELSKKALHWIFVRPDWRKIGIANMLLPPSIYEQIKVITHLSFKGWRLNKIKLKAEFNPFLL